MAQAHGLAYFNALQLYLRTLSADADSLQRKGWVRGAVMALILAPAVLSVILTIIAGVTKPNYFSGDQALVQSPFGVILTLIRCVVPFFSYTFLLEYVQKSKHFDTFVLEATAANPAIPATLSRFGRRVEIIYLILIFPCYALVEVLSRVIGTEFDSVFSIISMIVNVLSIPVQLCVISIASLLVTLLSFIHILDINNFSSMIPTMELERATEEWSRIVRSVKETAGHTASFCAVLFILTSIAWLIYLFLMVLYPAFGSAGILFFYLLMMAMALRMAGWVTDRLRSLVDDINDEYGKHPSTALVQFFMKVSAVPPSWRIFKIAVTPGSFLLMVYGYMVSFVALALVAGVQLLNVPNPSGIY